MLEVLKIMHQLTDEKHHLSIKDIVKKLNEQGIKANRKTIYNDFRYINEQTGFEVVGSRGANSCYFLSGRQLEVAELKLLIDAVQCAQFISVKKSEALIERLSVLASKFDATQLSRQISIEGRSKSNNEQILYNVDILNEAIIEKRRVTFQYFDYNYKLEEVFRRDEKGYNMFPVCLMWADNKYYLVTYSFSGNQYYHYRVDRMKMLEKGEIENRNIEKILNVANYSKEVFHMYAGQKKEVELLVDETMINQVVDHFGLEVEFQLTSQPDVYVCKQVLEVSSTFFSWLSQYNGSIQILNPRNVQEEYINFLEKNLGKIKNLSTDKLVHTM